MTSIVSCVVLLWLILMAYFVFVSVCFRLTAKVAISPANTGVLPPADSVKPARFFHVASSATFPMPTRRKVNTKPRLLS